MNFKRASHRCEFLASSSHKGVDGISTHDYWAREPRTPAEWGRLSLFFLIISKKSIQFELMFGCFPACMCALYEYSACKGHRRASDTPDLESQLVVICHVSAGTHTRSSGRPKPSPQLPLLPFKINSGFAVHCMCESESLC